jgi:hypothetical protein
VRILSILLASCLLLAGCGSDAPDTDRVSLSYNESPITELLGIDLALCSGDLVELERAAEQGIVECMKGVGFEYIAVDFASQSEPESGAENPDSRKYVARNGYGISTRPAVDVPSSQDVIDPNDELRAQLSDGEPAAYSLALYGESPRHGDVVAPEERTGCVAESFDSVYAAQAELGAVEAFFGEFSDELTELEARFRSDPRFLELEDQWSICMADRGFTVEFRNDIFVELNRRMSEIAPLIVGGEEPSNEVQQLMDEVADWERSAAVADWYCTQPVQGEMQTLRYGYEALFLDEQQGRISAAIG